MYTKKKKFIPPFFSFTLYPFSIFPFLTNLPFQSIRWNGKDISKSRKQIQDRATGREWNVQVWMKTYHTAYRRKSSLLAFLLTKRINSLLELYYCIRKTHGIGPCKSHASPRSPRKSHMFVKLSIRCSILWKGIGIAEIMMKKSMSLGSNNLFILSSSINVSYQLNSKLRFNLNTYSTGM